VSLFELVLILGGAIGVVGGLWPLLTGRNFPGVLGRGFTNGDNLRLKRAPAIYFRAMGASIATFGLLILDLGAAFWLSAVAPATDPTLLAIAGAIAAMALAGSLVWLLVLTHRHKLFRWNAP
jgi:formate hydrogenlyase subunit 3/multisubunit Na+/H+ antiporter MnhD subunit